MESGLGIVESCCIGERFCELSETDKSIQSQLYNIVSGDYERLVESIINKLDIDIIKFGELKDSNDNIVDNEDYINHYLTDTILNNINRVCLDTENTE